MGVKGSSPQCAAVWGSHLIKNTCCFPGTRVLMVCHVNACALFKVITPLQSATVTQLLTSWPCIFHVLLLVSSLPPEQFSGAKKHLLTGKTKPVPQSVHIQGILPTLVPDLCGGQLCLGQRWSPPLPLAHTVWAVWSVKAECASSSHPTTAVCSSAGRPVLASLPAPICDFGWGRGWGEGGEGRKKCTWWVNKIAQVVLRELQVIQNLTAFFWKVQTGSLLSPILYLNWKNRTEGPLQVSSVIFGLVFEEMGEKVRNV